MSNLSLGSFGAFPIFDGLMSRIRLVVEQNGQNLDLKGTWSKYLVHIKYIGLLRIQVHFVVIRCISDFR